MARAKKRKLPSKKISTASVNNKESLVDKEGQISQSEDVFKAETKDTIEAVKNKEAASGSVKKELSTRKQKDEKKSDTKEQTDSKEAANKQQKKEEGKVKDTKKDVIIDESGQEKSEKEEVDEVTAIYYVDDDGSRIDMTKMDQSRGKSKYIFGVLFILGLLGLISYLGYLVFNRDFGSQNNEVKLTVSIEDKVASGDLVTLSIEYLNDKSVDISTGEIEVLYPGGFKFQSASVEPINDSNRIWELGNIKPGAGGKIRIAGQLVGAKDDNKEFTVRMTYQPANFSHDFQITESAKVLISSSIVEVEIEAPNQAQSGQEITYKVTYKNSSKVPLSDVKILIDYPKDFTFTKASEEPWGGDHEWRLEQLAAGEERKLEVTGSLEGNSGETKEFSFQLGIIEIDNTFNVQIEKTSLVLMANPEVSITIEAPELVSPGDIVQVTVNIENTSEIELKDLDVQLSLAGPLFKKDKYSFKQIKKLPPNQSKELKYETELKQESKSNNQTLEIVAKVVSAFVDGSTVEFPNQATAELKVKGDFAVSVEGRYYDDDLSKIGSGPIPPQVGSETVYVIRWNIAAGSNAINNLHISTALPEDVVWEKKASKYIQYDSQTRTVTYTKDKIKADSESQLEFSVRILPTADDYNKLMVLTNETAITAIDTFTNEEISLQADRITTDLASDSAAKGQGVVEGSPS